MKLIKIQIYNTNIGMNWFERRYDMATNTNDKISGSKLVVLETVKFIDHFLLKSQKFLTNVTSRPREYIDIIK